MFATLLLLELIAAGVSLALANKNIDAAYAALDPSSRLMANWTAYFFVFNCLMLPIFVLLAIFI